MARNFKAHSRKSLVVHLFSKDSGLSRCTRYWYGNIDWTGNAENFVRVKMLTENQRMCAKCVQDFRKPQEKR